MTNNPDLSCPNCHWTQAIDVAFIRQFQRLLQEGKTLLTVGGAPAEHIALGAHCQHCYWPVWLKVYRHTVDLFWGDNEE